MPGLPRVPVPTGVRVSAVCHWSLLPPSESPVPPPPPPFRCPAGYTSYNYSYTPCNLICPCGSPPAPARRAGRPGGQFTPMARHSLWCAHRGEPYPIRRERGYGVPRRSPPGRPAPGPAGKSRPFNRPPPPPDRVPRRDVSGHSSVSSRPQPAKENEVLAMTIRNFLPGFGMRTVAALAVAAAVVVAALLSVGSPASAQTPPMETRSGPRR